MQSTPTRRLTGSIVLAAMALPGVWTAPAQAQTSAPEKGLIGLKYLRYQDSQEGLDRITVDAPSAYVLAPLTRKLALEASMVYDSLSGATPQSHSSIASASMMEDGRTAGDLKVTYYTGRSSYGVGMGYSTENDYESLSFSLNAAFSTANNNTTFGLGYGYSNDTIQGVEGAFNQNENKKTTNEFLVSLTQAMTPRDLLQVNLTLALGEGYFDDPYKLFDFRPGERTQAAFLTRWNHHFSGTGSSLRTSYRFYNDDFGIQAHAFQLDWAQSFGPSFTVTPTMRYYTQTAADFYSDPDANGNVVAPLAGQFNSVDHRLSAFGALTFGLRADLRLGAGWSFDAKGEYYRQSADYRLGGDGSPGIDDLRAYFLQFGINRSF